MKTARQRNQAGQRAVKEKSGKSRAEWFAILDKAGAKGWKHHDISAYLRDREGVSPWWSQMISVDYERERGIRQLFQKCDGAFSASASRTVSVPLSRLFRVWADEQMRRKWMGKANLEVTTTTKNKYFRAKWDGGKSRLSVGFYARGQGKSQVAVDHEKLTDPKECARMKVYWSEALDRLEEFVSS
jgi:hypothetical protein